MTENTDTEPTANRAGLPDAVIETEAKWLPNARPAAEALQAEIEDAAHRLDAMRRSASTIEDRANDARGKADDAYSAAEDAQTAASDAAEHAERAEELASTLTAEIEDARGRALDHAARLAEIVATLDHLDRMAADLVVATLRRTADRIEAEGIGAVLWGR